MAKPITYVGLDVHKDTIAVALAEAGLRGEVREHGKVPNTPAALKALTVKLATAREENCGSVMKPDHAVTAFSDNSRKRDTNAPSSRHR